MNGSKKASAAGQFFGQVKKALALLRENAGQKFTMRQVAAMLIASYPEHYATRRGNYGSDSALSQQVAAELSSLKPSNYPELGYDNSIKPALVWCQILPMQIQPVQDLLTQNLSAAASPIKLPALLSKSLPKTAIPRCASLTEQDLYPLLIKFLQNYKNLYCRRIDEKTSRNSHGSGGNYWLHPDIAAMQVLDEQWHSAVRACVQNTMSERLRLWSFEVKLELKKNNVRESFFQAVSNSSWANEGYLVTARIAGDNIKEELRILSALHGIGVIVLNSNDLEKSEIFLPAQRKAAIDWNTVNRIVQENKDFEIFISKVHNYISMGKVMRELWR